MPVVPRHRFHPSSPALSGEWDRAATTLSSTSSSHTLSSSNMFRLRTSNRCAVLSLSAVALVLGSVVLWLSAAHSSFAFLFDAFDGVLVSEDDMSVDILTPVRHYPPTELLGTPAAINYIAATALFFLHVPKTAGQSFTTALSLASEPYRPILASRYAQLDEPTKGGRPRVRKGSGRRLDLTFMQRPELFDMLKEEKHERFRSLYSSRVLVFGHVDVHIAQQFQQDGRQVDFITLLRSPEERVLSHFCYMQTTWQESKRHALVYPSWFNFLGAKSADAVAHLPPLPPLPADEFPSPFPLPVPALYPAAPMSNASFVYYYRSTPMDRIDNWHTRAYAGCLHIPTLTSPQRDAICNSSETMLAEAKRQLRGFLFVGLTEHYNQTLRLLNYTLNANVDIGNASAAAATAQSQAAVAAAAPVRGRRFGNRGNPSLLRKTGRILNMNRKKSQCIVSISGNSSNNMERMMDEIRAVEWMDMRLYEYATRLFWARVEAVEAISPGFMLPRPGGGS